MEVAPREKSATAAGAGVAPSAATAAETGATTGAQAGAATGEQAGAEPGGEPRAEAPAEPGRTEATAATARLSRFALGALLVTLALVYSDLVVEWVRDWMRDPNYNHGFLIPPIAAYLIWKKRAALREIAPAPSNWGLAGLVGAAALLILGSAGAEVFTQRVSFVALLPSLVLFLYGWGAFRLTIFPFALLLLAIPLPYLIYYGLTAPMQLFAAKCAVYGLKLVGVPVAAQGNIIHLANTSLEVADACSGIRSLYAFLTLGALMAYSTPVPLWGRLLIFLLTIPLSVAGNAVRVFGTGIGAYLVGPEVAEGTIHEAFGMLVIVISLGVFLGLKKLAGKLWSERSSRS